MLLAVILLCLACVTVAKFGQAQSKAPTRKAQNDKITEQSNFFAIDTFDAEWTNTISHLENRSTHLFRQWFEDENRKLFDLPMGVPGTGLHTKREARALQEYLDCVSSRGEWVYSPTGLHLAGSSLPVHKQSPVSATCDKAYYKQPPFAETRQSQKWDVRPDLKWYWKPSATCSSLVTPPWMRKEGQSLVRPLLSRRQLCAYLRYKSILLVGDSPTHYLVHDLILDWTSTRPLTCYGDLYCKEHAICSDDLFQNTSSNEWDGDIRVYDRLQDPPNTSLKRSSVDSGTAKSFSTDTLRRYGTVLRYRRADSMFLNSSPSHPRHQPTSIHPHIGVREINMYSVADGRRSDVVLLYKAPLPYPRASHSGSSLNNRLIKMTSTLEQSDLKTDVRIQKLLELAAVVTAEIWLPEMMESIRALKAPPAPSDALIVYRGGWAMQSDCGMEERTERLNAEVYKMDSSRRIAQSSRANTAQLLLSSFASKNITQDVSDMHTLFYNIQTTLQNHLMRSTIAPQLGIPFIDLQSATSTRRSGFVGQAGAGRKPSTQARRVNRKAVDCLRMCLPSPGLSLETLLLGALQTIFEWGWDGPEQNKTWIGEDFFPVRLRNKLPVSKEEKIA